MTDEAIAAMRELKEPFFLWLAYHAPHTPYHWPPGVQATASVAGARYDAVVTHLDSEVGRLLDAMTPEQRATTVIVFVGDNGTPKDAIRPPFRPGQGKTTVFEGGTNVPWIVAGAGVTGRGESPALVHAVDLLPTLLELAGVSAEGLVLDGVSFARQLEDPTAPSARTFVYTERFTPNGPPPYRVSECAIRDDRYKLWVRKRGQTGHADLLGHHDDGGRLPPTVAPERFVRLEEELKRIRRNTLFAW
jgi:arylsulfatase A-like enzyme